MWKAPPPLGVSGGCSQRLLDQDGSGLMPGLIFCSDYHRLDRQQAVALRTVRSGWRKWVMGDALLKNMSWP